MVAAIVDLYLFTGYARQVALHQCGDDFLHYSPLRGAIVRTAQIRVRCELVGC
jgi:hypothetical protein